MADKAGTKIRYVGPHGAVDVPALGKTVRRGQQVEVEDKAVAASLLRQEDWEEVGGKAAEKQDETPAEAPKGG